MFVIREEGGIYTCPQVEIEKGPRLGASFFAFFTGVRLPKRATLFRCPFGVLAIVTPYDPKSFRIYGGGDGARTRDLCRDSYANWLYLNDFMGVDG